MISPDETIPQILQRAPHLRTVLDRYGLKGCGGPLGPDETLAFFSAAHGVDLPKLLQELRGLDLPAPATATPDHPPTPAPQLADSIYRPFFLAGLAFALVPGALVGLYLVWRAWLGQSLVAPPINIINAHAHSMLAGFMSMFIMGFGYQALPRFKHAALYRPGLALASFCLVCAGVVLRVTGEMLALDTSGALFSLTPHWLVMALVGSAMEVTALSLFAWLLWNTYRQASAVWAAYDRYVFAAAGWLVVAALGAAVHLVLISTSGSFLELVPRIAMVQEPLRMVQLLGCAVILILGVMQRFLPPVFGFADPGQRVMRRWFWPLNLGLVVMAVSFPWAIAAKRGMLNGPLGVRALETAYWLALLVFSISTLRILAGFRSWKHPTGNDRSIKFARAAHGWLALAMLLWLAEPLYIAAVVGHFGHGFHGAVRHTLTLGFIAQMIMAISLKVIPTLRGVNVATLGRQRTTFLLLNLAVALRIAGEIAADFTGAGFTLLAVAAVIAATALLLWAGHVGRLLLSRSGHGAVAPALELAAGANVAAVLARWPQTLPVFVSHGFGMLTNPVARQTLARTVSLAQACALKQVDLAALLQDLRTATGQQVPPAPPTAPAPPTPPAPPAPRVDATRTVADVARSFPRTVPVLSRLGLDACCGGEESIAVAAEHNGHALPQVLQQLEEAIGHDAT